MEIKKDKEKLNFVFFNSKFIIAASLLVYYFFGFYTDENSAGAGGYNADLGLIWNNLNLLKKDLFLNLDNPLYNDSRTPLPYILHILFNPFINDLETFRTSVFLISSTVPLLLFLAIKENYPKLDKNIVLLLALIVTLSPYFRTSSFWGLSENYAFIFLILSYLIYQKLNKNILIYKDIKIFFFIFLICFLSSIIVYLDQKLIFIPLIFFINLTLSNLNNKFKYFSALLFFLFAIPYIYLIYLWGSIIPTTAAQARVVGSQFHVFNPIYCLIIIAFYIFPFLLIKEKKIFLIKQLKTKETFVVIFFTILFFLSALYFGDFKNLSTDGKGAFFKLSNIIFNNINLRIFVTLAVFIVSCIIISLFFDKRVDLFIILFFFILSGLTYPFYQEYLDPIIYILIFTFFNTKLDLKMNNIYFLIIYFAIFSLGSKFYYSLIL